jgi:hypothetical protein
MREPGQSALDRVREKTTFGMLFIGAANTPAAAGYLRRPGETSYQPFVISVLDIEDDQLARITAFEAAHLITAFGLPASL